MQKKILDKKIVITGGGSGGHVSVATSIIEELEKRYTNTQEKILYIGGDLAMVGDNTSRSIEEIRMDGRGYKFVKVRAGKLQRIFSLKAIPLLFRTIYGIFDAYKYVKEFKPDFVISTGGFVTVPVAISCFLQKIPLYIHEQTAAVGLTNQLSGKIAKKIFVTFPESLQYFPKDKTEIIGNPIRQSIFEENKGTPLLDELEKMKKQKDKYPIIYISGGGLGSHVINVTVRDTLVHLLDKYQIILQTGDNQTFKDFQVLSTDREKLPKDKRERLFITKFVSDFEIGSVFKNTDLYLGRSGANTVYELGVLNIPCILIPIPWVTHNEQEKNAKVLEHLGLASILPEGELSRENLIEAIKQKLNSPKEIQSNKEIFPVDSASKLLDRVLD